MTRSPRLSLWLTALALVGAQALFFLVPMLLSSYALGATSAEEVSRLAREHGSRSYLPLMVQVLGGLLLVPAAWGVHRVCVRAGRGGRVSSAGRVVAGVGTVSALLLLGMELAHMHTLLTTPDTDTAVGLVVTGQDWWVYVVMLLIALAVVLLLPIVLGVALARAGVVPVPALILFLVPLASGFVPMPAGTAEIVGVAGQLVPVLVLAFFLLRSAPSRTAHGHDGAPRLAIDQV